MRTSNRLIKLNLVSQALLFTGETPVLIPELTPVCARIMHSTYSGFGREKQPDGFFRIDSGWVMSRIRRPRLKKSAINWKMTTMSCQTNIFIVDIASVNLYLEWHCHVPEESSAARQWI
jgi:hypothetical protein